MDSWAHGAPRLPGDGLGGGVGAVDLGEDHRQAVFLYKPCDLIDLLGGGLTPLLLLNGGQQGQVKGLSKIAESVVEGDQAADLHPGVLLRLLNHILESVVPGVEQTGLLRGVLLILPRVLRVRLGEAVSDVVHHLLHILRVHPVVGVEVAVVIILLPVLVDMALALQQIDSLGAVDDRGAGGGQGVLHKFLHAGPVQGHHVGPLKLLHVPHGEGVVVEAGHRPRLQPEDGDALHPLRHRPGGQVDRIGGGQHRQAGLLPVRSAGPGGGAARQQQGQEGHKSQCGTFVHRCISFLRVRSLCASPPPQGRDGQRNLRPEHKLDRVFFVRDSEPQ